MKTKILMIGALVAFGFLILGTGPALAHGTHRGAYYVYPKHKVVVHPVRHRVVYAQPRPAYGHTRVHRNVHVQPRPVFVERAPVYYPAPAGWGFTIYFGY
jgi:hypothetical protein